MSKRVIRWFVLGTCAALPLAVSAQQEQEPFVMEMKVGPPPVVGFYTVKEAREKLFNRERLQRDTDDDGWVQLHDRVQNVLWSFVPEDHYAYPSVIKRSVAAGSAGRRINMDALCEAPREACLELMEYLRRENAIANNHLDRMPHRGMGVNSDIGTPLASLISAIPK